MFDKQIDEATGLHRAPEGVDHSGPQSDIGTGHTGLQSISQLDEFLSDVALMKHEHEKIPLLCNHYLNIGSVADIPRDPFSQQYREFVIRFYEKISKRKNYDPTRDEKSSIDIESMSRRPPCYQGNGQYLSQFLHAFADVIEKLDVSLGIRTLEYGPGDGQIALYLSRLGCNVTVIDIEGAYLEVIKLQAERLGSRVKTVLGDFMSGSSLGKFDRVLFFEAFHHALNHNDVLRNLQSLVDEGGKIVFAGEPIIDPLGPWRNAVPYPWGLRLDALSLRAVKTNGWLELGFQDQYFREACARAGWSVDHQPSERSPISNAYVATRR